VARTFATVVTSPLKLIRTRQASNAASQSMMSEFRSVLRSSNGKRNHLASLYKGLKSYPMAGCSIQRHLLGRR
jgi:hypothetical protein